MRHRLLLVELLLLSLLLEQVITTPMFVEAGSGLKGLQPDELSGRQIDVFTQSGGEGSSAPDGFFGPEDGVYLFANASYNGWPVVGVIVAFEVRTANGSIFTASGEMTNQTGTAVMNLRLPRPETLIEPYYGYWKVTATVAIAEVLVNDTVQFKLLHLIPGDVNRDYVVDIIDLTVVALAFSSTPEEPNWNPRADINDDGTVDIFDLITVAVHFSEESW